MPQAFAKLIAPLLSLIAVLAVLVFSVVALPVVLLLMPGWAAGSGGRPAPAPADAGGSRRRPGRHAPRPRSRSLRACDGQVIDGECVREPGPQEYLPRQP